MKQIQISEVVNVLNKSSIQGPHISFFLGRDDLHGKRARSASSLLRSKIDEAEYLLKKSGLDEGPLTSFRAWAETDEWLNDEESTEHSHAFFVNATNMFWLKVPNSSEIESSAIVSESWHLKPLLNYLTKADAKVIRRALKSFKKAQSKRRTTDALAEITQYALNGQVKTLLISNARKVWGELDRWSGRVRIHGKQENARDDDLLDDLAEIVMRFKGRVLVVPDEWMPTVSPIAAII